jgi:6-phosphogluconolactonase
VANELDSTVALLRRDGDGFRLTDVVKTIPGDTVSYPSAVHTSPDGSLVYVANRGHDTIASLRRDAGGDTLTLIDTAACGGRPRDMMVDVEAGRLLVANQHNHEVTSLPLGDDYLPGDIDARWSVPHPSCPLVWTDAPA